MRRLLLALGLLLVAAPASAEKKAPARGAWGGGRGLTPGGLVWYEAPGSGRVVLLGTDGAARGSFDLLVEEKFLLGVTDSGSRVTSPYRSGVLPDDGRADGEATERKAHLVFRSEKGDVLAIREPAFSASNEPAVFGDEAFTVSRKGRSLVLSRTSAAEEATPLLTVSVDAIRKETGKIEEVRVHASAAGVVLEIRGPYRSAYADASAKGRLVWPDPGTECGGGRLERLFPAGEREIARIFKENARSRTLARLEVIDGDGRVLRSADLADEREEHPLPGGGLLVFDESEMTVVDARGVEVSRVPFAPTGEDSSAAARGAAAKKRLASLGTKASGADWVDASLASTRVAYEFLSALRRDARGALDRLAAVPDGSPEEKGATGLLAFVLRSPGFAAMSDPAAKPNDAQAAKREAESLKAHAAHLAEEGAPRWFTRTAAAYVLAEHPKPPPAWATAATAEAIASGETSSLDSLPEDVLTPELAALASAFDRDRIDRVEREHPDVAKSLEAMFGFGEDVDAGSLAFHVPAGRFAEELLSCLRGAGPLRFSAAVQALALPAWNETQRRTIERGVRGEVYPFAGELPPADDTATARVAAALGAARRSEDAAVRAGVQILSPLYGLPLDFDVWSRDVAARPSAAALALPYLELDRGLPRREWIRLFAATLAGARSESRDPFACATRDFRFSAGDAESPRDGYCTLIQTLFQYGLDEDDPDRPGSSRASEIAEFTRSNAAPPEVHLHAKLGRALTGKASDAEVLELWRDKDLPWSVRQMVVSSGQESPSASLTDQWLRELREGRLSPGEEAVLLSAARRTEPAEAGRLAARRFEEGRVPLGGTDGRAKAWSEALDKESVAASPAVREALRKALSDEEAGPQAAAALAKAGDATALPWLVVAIKTGCLG